MFQLFRITDDLDLSCDELRENGIQVDTPFDGPIAFSDATFHRRQ